MELSAQVFVIPQLGHSGLAIVYNIMQKHNGKIQVDSEVGEEMKVTVILSTEQIRST